MRDDDTDIEALPASVSFRFVSFRDPEAFLRYLTLIVARLYLLTYVLTYTYCKRGNIMFIWAYWSWCICYTNPYSFVTMCYNSIATTLLIYSTHYNQCVYF